MHRAQQKLCFSHLNQKIVSKTLRAGLKYIQLSLDCLISSWL